MFTNSPEAPTWLYEGAADYVAYQTLTSLDLISQPYFSYFYEQQQAECLEVLKEKPLNSVDNTPYFFAAYSCGRVLFEVLSHNFNGEDHLGLLKQLLKSSPEAGYSVSDFLELIKTKPKTKEISDAVLDVLESQSNAHKAFEALITL
jgi:hypothetical protein